MILQKTLPYDADVARRLPGVMPLGDLPWLIRDDAFDAQMALRDQLVQERPDKVMARIRGADVDRAVDELRDEVLNSLRADPGYRFEGDRIRRPDGMFVDLDADPLPLLARLVQEDLCLLLKPDGAQEHILAAATLCFPAGWTLGEKLGRPLMRIHDPVAEYDTDLGKRVQRLFDGVQVGRPLWRFNALEYHNPDLYQPLKEAEPKKRDHQIGGTGPVYLRSERQSVLRLPQSRAVIFGIHTFVLRRR